jgi:oligopeptide transport system permease protein
MSDLNERLRQDLAQEEDVQDNARLNVEPHEADPLTTAAIATDVEAPLRQATLWGDAWRQLRKSPLFLVASLLIVVFAVMAIRPQLFTGVDPRNCDLVNSVEPPTSKHWFGYDIQGCDYFARVVYGARVSMIIGLLVAGLSAAIGTVVGTAAGYYGGFLDTAVARMADIVFAIPVILGGIVLLSALGDRGLLQVGLVLILLTWPTLMRLMRSTCLSVKNMDYVQAARALGANDSRIMRVHILPNAIAPVLVYTTITIGIAISAEAALSFLGVGLQLPAISWGLQISTAQSRILLSPHLLAFPGLFLVLVVLSFILMGDALRDALDPRLRR